jgi:hypothetical protein
LPVHIPDLEVRRLGVALSRQAKELHKVGGVLRIGVELLGADVLDDGLKLIPCRCLPDGLVEPALLDARRRVLHHHAIIERQREHLADKPEIFVERGLADPAAVQA